MTRTEGQGPEAKGESHVLLAVDESENSKRAVRYVGDLLGGVPGFRVTLLHILPEPSEDYFDSRQNRDEWIKDHGAKAAAMLENFRNILVRCGFRPEKVSILLEVTYCESIADCILNVQERLRCCTLVIGRRGMSKREEIIFGSTSNTILHSGRNCALWVIE